MKKTIIISFIALIIVVVIYNALLFFIPKKSVPLPAKNTPSPTSQQIPTKLTPEKIAQKSVFYIQQSQSKLSTDQRNALREFNKKLPFSTNTFSILYSEKLHRYFITIKSQQGYEDNKSFLKESNVLDVYLKGTEGFSVVLGKSDKSLKTFEDEYINSVETDE